MTGMSRYPFRECVNEVMSKYRGNRAASTLEVMERRYNRMERDLNQLRAEGRISTTFPVFSASLITSICTLSPTKGLIPCLRNSPFALHS